MHGFQQGMMDAGRGIGELGGRLCEAGGHGVGALDITCLVLGVILWAAVMTTLVMSMIALVRYLKKPKKEASDK